MLEREARFESPPRRCDSDVPVFVDRAAVSRPWWPRPGAQVSRVFCRRGTGFDLASSDPHQRGAEAAFLATQTHSPSYATGSADGRPSRACAGGEVGAMRSCWHLPVGVFVTGMVLLSPGLGRDALARPIDEQVCNAGADYSLGIEDYAEATRLHQRVLHQHPDNALAHYHLGFAEGMMGWRAAEIAEYQRADALGLRNWDLFLNLGMAQFEEGELDGAAASLQRAVLLGEDHFESHFNLALVDERRGMLAEAERETLAALRLNPRQTEALNLQGVIYAREGQTVRASRVFQEIIRGQPDYQPARANLPMLDGLNGGIAAETRSVDPGTRGIGPEPPRARATLRRPVSEMSPRPNSNDEVEATK